MIVAANQMQIRYAATFHHNYGRNGRQLEI